MILAHDTDALFLDVDGTLLNIAETPQSVTVPSSLITTLERLSLRLGGALALISGRTLSDLDTLFYPLRLPAAGSHGAEWRLSSRGAIQTGTALPAELVERIKATFMTIPGVVIEDKVFVLAIHYRQAPQAREECLKRLEEILSPYQAEIGFIEGKMVFEVGFRNQDKALAIRRFLATATFSKRRPIFIGDDAVDSSAIKFCRSTGGIGLWVGDKNTAEGMADTQAVRYWLKLNAG